MTRTILVVAALVLAGCSTRSTIATYSGLNTPVLLGPVDRIAAKDPLPTTVIRQVEMEVSAVETESQYHWNIGEDAIGYLASEAQAMCKDDPSLDIRITDLMPAAWVGSYGVTKAYVDVEGELVRHGEAAK